MVNKPEGARIIKIDPWLDSPAGRYLLAWEQAQLDRMVADVFGFHALQLGWPALCALRANRMPHRWLLTDQTYDAGRAFDPARSDSAVATPWPVSLQADFDALPFPANSLDLVVLPHTLELARDAHHTLREVERVLVSEGRVIVLGFNPASLWGLRHRFSDWPMGLGPAAGDAELLGWRRLRDWLRLLGFEVEAGRFGCYRPALQAERWLERWAWMDRWGDRWWPVLGSVYCMVAVKRVRGMRLVGRIKTKRVGAVGAPAIVTHAVTPSVTDTVRNRKDL